MKLRNVALLVVQLVNKKEGDKMNGNFNRGDRVQLSKITQSDTRMGLELGDTGTVMDNHSQYPDVLFDGKPHIVVMGEWQLQLISK